MYPSTLVSTDQPTAGGTGSADGTKMMSDNLVYGITAIYDTNGAKGPNVVSNCNSAALGVKTDVNDADVTEACTKSRRVIKDQFGVRLRGGYAVPNGAAARWAFEN